MQPEEEKTPNTQKPGNTTPEITYRAIRKWPDTEIIDLYRAGGWWEMGWDKTSITPLIRGSYLFIIALDTTTGRAIGMGRILSDGVSDGYIQDIVVLPNYRERGIATTIAHLLKNLSTASGITWIGLIAAPGRHSLYQRAGFSQMNNHTPMNLDHTPSHHDTQ